MKGLRYAPLPGLSAQSPLRDAGPSNGSEAKGVWRHDHPNRAQHKLDEAEKRTMAAFESLDYEVALNAPYMRERQRLREHPRERMLVSASSWIVFAVVGVLVGTAGFLIDGAVDLIVTLKYAVVNSLLRDGETGTIVAFVALVATNAALAATSAALVSFFAPVAAGSGIPEVKGFLNGTNYPRFLRLRTLAVKVVGIVLSVSSGLLCGKEGPLIHTGAIIAANVAHAPRLRRLLPHASWPFLFRNDRAKRDFVSGGAAAGVAAAFGAPVGGVLFALEEASSFWSVPLTWRVFFCSMLGAFTLNLWQVWLEGKTSFGGLVSFGTPDSSRKMYELWELPLFLLLGVVGGLVGACFCAANMRLCRWRRSRLGGGSAVAKRQRIIEVACIAVLTTVAAFGLPAAGMAACAPVPGTNITAANAGAAAPETAAAASSHYERFTCPEGQFNSMATIIFTGHGGAIRAFFHDTAPLSPAVLMWYCVAAFVLAALTYGTAVPSGLFVPCILIGSAFGRLLGEMVELQYGHGTVNPGTYALVGATAMLGGVTRITICLTVIMLETTDDLRNLLPIMCVVMVSKWVADVWNISVYDSHMELKCIPFVESEPPMELEALSARDIMCAPAEAVRGTESVGHLLHVLRRSAHCGFPVIGSTGRSDGREGKLLGMVTRNTLVVLLRHRVAALTQRWDSSYALNNGRSAARRSLNRIARVGGNMVRRTGLGGAAGASPARMLRSGTGGGDMEMCVVEAEEIGTMSEDVDVDVDIDMDEDEDVDVDEDEDENENVDVENADGDMDFTAGASHSAGTSAARSSHRSSSPHNPMRRTEPLEEELLELRHFASTLQSKTAGLDDIEALLGFGHGSTSDDIADAAFASECADDEREKQRVREAPVFIEPYMNPDPLSVQPGASVERCYRLFRGVGLRHLPVVDDSLRPLGVITRKDLMSSFTQDLF